MLYHIESLISREQVETLRTLIGRGQFIDGRLTAGKVARQVKLNQELRREPTLNEQVGRVVIGALAGNALFKSAAFPARVADPLVARYQPGMRYGDHVDDPVMVQGGERMRTDLSLTLFLSPPDSYQGGELVIRTPFGEQQVKLAAGDAVLYPSSSLHRVAEVTAGERLVALAWIQSHVRDAAQRALLHELNLAREALLERDPEDPATKRVDQGYANLVRMWSEV